MNSMIAVSAICAFLLGSALSVSGGTWRDDFEDGDLYGWIKFGDGKWEVVNDKCKVFSNLHSIHVLSLPPWSCLSFIVCIISYFANFCQAR